VSSLPSGWRSQLSVLDDGRGQIICPLRGLMAIGRCLEFQRESSARAAACTCDVFLAYSGGEPDAAVDIEEPPLEQHLCGRQIDEELEELIANRNEARAPARQDEKGAPMATKPKVAQPCARCTRKPPAGSRVKRGLCKLCRDEDARAEAIAQSRAAAGLAQTTESPAPEPTRAAAPSSAKKHPARQETLPGVAACEIEHLKRELAEKDAELEARDREIKRLRWAMLGAVDGHVGLGALRRLIEPQGAAS